MQTFMDPMQTLGDPQQTLVDPTRGIHIGHVNFMLFVSFRSHWEPTGPWFLVEYGYYISITKGLVINYGEGGGGYKMGKSRA